MANKVLEGKTVLMTGAARGMGRAMAVALTGAGANVAMIDIDRDALNEAAHAAEKAGGPGSVMAIICDVTDAERASSVAKQIVKDLGSLDILVNDAVIGPERVQGFMTEKSKFYELDDDLWNEMLRVNIFGPQLMAKISAPYMIDRGWGRIVNVTTSLDTMYLAGAGAYGPTKAALEAHTLIMSQDLDGTGVSANVLIPGGMVNTRMIPQESGIPREKLIQPDIMTLPIIWLASDASNGVSGMRFIGALWDETIPLEKRINASSAPCAWTQLPSKAIYPD